MQTQCPYCKKECDFPDDQRNEPADCPWCYKPFLARQIMGTKISDDFVEQLENPVSYIPNKPGTLYCVLGFVAIVLGLFGAREHFVFLVKGILAALIFFAVGIALNQLERIAYHSEQLRHDIKHLIETKKKAGNQAGE